jgi:hypothetical protein
LEAISVIAWLWAARLDIALHLALDTSGALTLRCAMGLCKHQRHQLLAWFVCAMLISTGTVALVG